MEFDLIPVGWQVSWGVLQDLAFEPFVRLHVRAQYFSLGGLSCSQYVHLIGLAISIFGRRYIIWLPVLQSSQPRAV